MRLWEILPLCFCWPSIILSLSTFESRAKHLQEQLWHDFEHRYYSGIRVLRDLARTQGGSAQAMMPVVFTSLLGQETSHDVSCSLARNNLLSHAKPSSVA